MSFWAIVGYGATGKSLQRWCQRHGQSYRIFADTPGHTGDSEIQPLRAQALRSAQRVLLSPGVDPRHPQLAEVQHLLGNDLSLFIESFADTPGYLPLALITGSNGKSTVTSMLGHICTSCGWDVGIGGNLATPMLDLRARQHDFYVLELSSFQLELGCQQPLRARLATMLNLSPDHLDRHHSLANYSAIKRQVFSGCQHALVNQDDSNCWPPHADASYYFSATTNAWAQLQEHSWVIGSESVAISADLPLVGKHNRLNALVALAAAKLLDLQPQRAATALTRFSPLPHRCQPVARINQVQYLNDSKATNLAATQATLIGLGTAQHQGKILLIAGGRSKGEQDYSELLPQLRRYARAAVLIGEEAENMQRSWQRDITCQLAGDLASAVRWCYQHSQPQDQVLLAPACASFDQFANYAERGDSFIELVVNLPGARVDAYAPPPQSEPD